MLALEAPARLRFRLDSDQKTVLPNDVVHGFPVNGNVELVPDSPRSPVRILLLEAYDALLKRIVYACSIMRGG